MSDPGSTARPQWAEFRAALDAAGFRPSRRLGQNFLLDENMCAALVRDAEVAPGDRVLEVGAGCGFLTAHLAAAGARVLAVEVDPRLYRVAGGFVGGRPEIELLLLDALAGKRRLAPELVARLPREGDWLVVSNLAYSIAGPVLALLAELEHPPARLSVLIQREVAERILAPAGSAARGPLAVKLEAGYRGRILRDVPPGLFWPRPRVQSSVLRLDRRPGTEGPDRARRLDPLLRLLFQRRRQGIVRVLGERFGSRARAQELCARLGLDPRRRPGELALEEWVALVESPEWEARSAEGGPRTDSAPGP